LNSFAYINKSIPFAILSIVRWSGVCGGGAFACGIIDQHLKRFLIGQDPFNIELIWDQMNRSTLPYGLGGVTSMAMAGVDFALYDLIAKAQKLPVYKIIGGQTKEAISC
jgi:L-rhamnonate dehydratase